MGYNVLGDDDTRNFMLYIHNLIHLPDGHQSYYTTVTWCHNPLRLVCRGRDITGKRISIIVGCRVVICCPNE